MAKLSAENLKNLKEIALVLSETDNAERIYDFLFCLLTENERDEVASRWALVKLIDDGMSQRKIADKLGLSLCKITRGSRELKKENSAFKEMIERFKELDPHDNG